jgi:hypothetical protein
MRFIKQLRFTFSLWCYKSLCLLSEATQIVGHRWRSTVHPARERGGAEETTPSTSSFSSECDTEVEHGRSRFVMSTVLVWVYVSRKSHVTFKPCIWFLWLNLEVTLRKWHPGKGRPDIKPCVLTEVNSGQYSRVRYGLNFLHLNWVGRYKKKSFIW